MRGLVFALAGGLVSAALEATHYASADCSGATSAWTGVTPSFDSVNNPASFSEGGECIQAESNGFSESF